MAGGKQVLIIIKLNDIDFLLEMIGSSILLNVGRLITIKVTISQTQQIYISATIRIGGTMEAGQPLRRKELTQTNGMDLLSGLL